MTTSISSEAVWNHTKHKNRKLEKETGKINKQEWQHS